MNFFASILAFIVTFSVVIFSKKIPNTRWEFTDSMTRQTCLLVQFDAKLNITYPLAFVTEDGEDSRVTNYTIPASDTLRLYGNCGDGVADQSVTMEWTEKNYLKTAKTTNTMELIFKFYFPTHLYALHKIIFDINATIFPNGSNQLSKYMYVGDDFWAPNGWSYSCDEVQTYEMSGINRRFIMGTVSLSNLQFEASLDNDINEFSKPFQCRGDNMKTKFVFLGIAAVVVIFIAIGVYIYFHRLRF